MKVTNEKTENCQAFLNIEMEPVEVEESLEKSYHRLVKRTKIPGFRKGKVPRPILERYIGKESLFQEALEHLTRNLAFIHDETGWGDNTRTALSVSEHIVAKAKEEFAREKIALTRF